jgi:hypothetical protein
MSDIAPAPAASTAPKPWYFNTSLVQLLLVFVFPLGFVLMWTGGVFSARTRWIVTGVLGFLMVAAMSGKPPPKGAKPTTSPTAASSEPVRIIATVDQFKDAIPLLRQLPMTSITRDGATEYGWSKVSSFGNPNTIRIYDLAGDGRLDWLMASVVIYDDRKDTNTESFMLAIRLIMVAGGINNEDATELISPWIPKAAMGGDTRRFGSVDVNVSYLKASGGGLLLIHIIGTEEGRAAALGESSPAPAPGSAP